MSNAPTLDNLALANVEIEQALLGAVLMSNGAALDPVEGIITPSDFSESIHAGLFEQFMVARHAGRAVDVIGGLCLSSALAQDTARGAYWRTVCAPGHPQRLACVAYISGAYDWATMATLTMGAKKAWCLPPGVGGDQLSLVFHKYLNAHPEQLHIASVFLLRLAMDEAFPCG